MWVSLLLNRTPDPRNLNGRRKLPHYCSQNQAWRLRIPWNPVPTTENYHLVREGGLRFGRHWSLASQLENASKQPRCMNDLLQAELFFIHHVHASSEHSEISLRKGWKAKLFIALNAREFSGYLVPIPIRAAFSSLRHQPARRMVKGCRNSLKGRPSSSSNFKV